MNRFIALSLIALTPVAQAESVDFVAEHILEIPMDLRYSSLPKPPDSLQAPERRLTLGYGSVSGLSMTNRLPMIGISQYIPAGDHAGFLLSAFLDQFNFSGSRATVDMAPSFGRSTAIPASFNAQTNSVSGRAYHWGLSAASVMPLREYSRIQIGVALEQLDVRRYRVAFTTLGLANNFDGTVDYAGRYNIVAPFAIYEGRRRNLLTSWSGRLSAVVAWPLPRVGFKGSITTPQEGFQGDTDSAGNGRHIPDPYLGLGYAIEHRASGIRADIGASLFSYLIEPIGHTKIDRVLFATVSVPF